MNLLIVTQEPFPRGMAATNRVLSHAKGMCSLSHSVEVVVITPTEKADGIIRNDNVRGVYEGIPFEYAPNTTLWPKSKLMKLFVVAEGFLKAARLSFHFSRRTGKKSVLLVSNSFAVIVFMFVVCALLRIPYVQEKSEYPFVLRRKNLFGRLYASLYTNVVYHLFDGMVIMTQTLVQYFRPRIRKSARVIVVPMTVEPERFLCDGSADNVNDKYVAYCGFMGDSKDGVSILIEAFSIISKKYPYLKLYLIGDTGRTEEFDILKEQVHALRLEDRVLFTGRISREKIPSLLSGATALALARPSGLQAHGGFPTKLGEYLSTGKPVVVTRVGEIPLYLEDRVSAFLAEPDSAKAFAHKLDEVLEDYDFALKVGMEGRNVVHRVFDYKVQAHRLADFFEMLA